MNLLSDEEIAEGIGLNTRLCVEDDLVQLCRWAELETLKKFEPLYKAMRKQMAQLPVSSKTQAALDKLDRLYEEIKS